MLTDEAREKIDAKIKELVSWIRGDAPIDVTLKIAQSIRELAEALRTK